MTFTAATFNIPYNREFARFDSLSANVVQVPETCTISQSDVKDAIHRCTEEHNKWKRIFIGLKTSFVLNLCFGSSILAITLVFLMGPYEIWGTTARQFVIIVVVIAAFLILLSLLSFFSGRIIRRIFKIRMQKHIDKENEISMQHGVTFRLFYEYVRLEGWWYKRWVNWWNWVHPAIHVQVKSQE
jgi:hypothetical protein